MFSCFRNWDLTLDLQQVYKVKKVRIKSSEKTSNDVNFFSIKVSSLIAFILTKYLVKLPKQKFSYAPAPYFT